MNESSGDRNPVELLAEEFIARKRRGEKPTLSEYTEQHPELAEEIREVFPALLMMEDLGDSLQGATGPHLGGGLTVTQIGDYRILREVGRGGMGVVFEAEQLSLGRRVALKVLPPYALKNEQQLRRFEREARAAARLHHTNIVPVFGVGHHDGTHYYVMQFIQGLGLDGVIEELRRLRTGHNRPRPEADAQVDPSAVQQLAQSLLTGLFQPDAPSGDSDNKAAPSQQTQVASDSTPRFPEGSDLSNASGSDRRYWRSVARIGVQVAGALEHAHSQGILHRDVKPSNLLMDTKGTVWVTDFGLAKTGEEEALTETGDVVGTLRYMAPERFRTAGDARSDVYSLGLTLYELLALRPAFNQRQRAQLIQEVLHGEPPRLRDLERAVPRDLATIVHKAIAREPRQRYARAGDLAADLQRFLDDRPIQARPIGNLEVLLKWLKRRPAIAALLALVVLVTVAGLAAFGWQYAEALREKENASEQARLKEAEARSKEQALEKAEQHAKDARQKEQTAREKEGIAREKEAIAQRSLDSLKRTLFTAQLVRAGSLAGSDPEAARELLEDAEACPPAMRDFSWGFYYGQASRSRWVLPEQAGSVDQIALSTDGKTLAVHYDAGSVAVWDLETAKVRVTLPGTWADKSYLLLSPDGRVLTTCATERFGWGTHARGLERWDTATGRSLGTVEASVLYGVAPVLSSNGRWLAAAVEKQIKVWEVSAEGCRPRAVLPLPPLSNVPRMAMSIAPDGRTLASVGDRPPTGAGAGDREVVLWDIAGGKERLRIKGTISDTGLVFSDDGKLLITANGGSATQWDAATGKKLELLEPAAAYVESLALSADNKTLVGGSGNGGATVWDLQNGKVRTFLRSARAPLAVTPDGATLLSISPHGAVLRWDIAPEAAVPVVRDWKPMHDSRGRLLPASLTPDGKYRALVSSGTSVRLADARTGRARAAVKDLPRKHELVFSSDGKTMAVLAEGDVLLYDAKTGKERGTFATRAGELAFAPGGSFCVAEVGRRTQERNFGQTLFRSWVEGLKVWNMAAGKEVALLKEAQGPVVFSADGKLFAGVQGEPRPANDVSQSPRRKPLRVKVWEAATGRERSSLEAAEPLAFGPDGRTLVLRGGSFPVPVLWDLAAERVRFTLEGVDVRQSSPGRSWVVVDESKTPAIHAEKTDVTGQTVNLLFSPDGKTLASAGAEGDVILWDVASGRETRRLRGHWGPVLALAFSANGRLLASGGMDRTVRLWDVPAERERHTLRGHTGPVVSLSFHGGDTLLSSRQDEIAVKLWKVASGEEYRLRGGPPACTAAALSPDGKTLATASGPEVDLWDATSGRQVGTLEGHAAAVTKLTFSANGQTLTSTNAVEMKQWDWKAGKETAGRPLAAAEYLGWLLSSDGRTLLVREKDVLTLRNVPSGEQRGSIEGVAGLPLFAPDGNRCAVPAQVGDGTGRRKPVLRLWDAAAGRELAVLEGAEPPVVFSADGKTVASRAQGPALVLWSTATGREQARLPGDWVPQSLSLAGDLVLVRQRDKGLALWKPDGRREPAFLADAALPAALAPDGKTVATAGPPFAVQLWDTSDGRRIGHLEGHQSAIESLVFAPDGRTLCSAARAESEATLELWDVAGRRERGSLRMQVPPNFVNISSPPFYAADGKTILWHLRGMLRRLEVETGKEVPAPEDIQATFVSAVSPDGRRLVVSRGSDHWLFEPATARSRILGDSSADPWGGGSWWFSNDGKKVVYHQKTVYAPQTALSHTPPAMINDRFVVFDAGSGREEAAYSLPVARPAPRAGDVPTDRRIEVRQAYVGSPALVLSDPATGRKLGNLDSDSIREAQRHPRGMSPFGPPAFSPDGKLLATAEMVGGPAYLVRVWDAADGSVHGAWHLGRSISRGLRLAFRADGRKLFVLTDKQLHRCDLATGKVESVALPLGSGHTPALGKDGTLVAYIVGGEVRLFDVMGDSVRTFVKLANVIALEMAPDGRYLAVIARGSSADGLEMRVFDVESKKQLWSTRVSFPSNGGPAVLFSEDGRSCAASTDAFTIQIWDVATGAQRGPYRASYYSMMPFALAPDGKSLAVHTSTFGVSIRDVASGREHHALSLPLSGVTQLLRFSPDGKTLLIIPQGGYGSSSCLLWSPSADTLRFLPATQGAAYSLAASPDGKLLAVGGSSVFQHAPPSLAILDTKTGRDRGLGLWQIGFITSAFSPDGKLLAFASEQSPLIRLWDFEKRALRYLPRNHIGGVLTLAFSPDGKTLASAGRDQTVRLWNVSQGKQAAVLEGLAAGPPILGFSADGKLLVWAVAPQRVYPAQKATPGQVKVWDVAAAKEHSGFTLGDRPGCLALSPDGALLAVAETDGKVTIREARGGKERATLKGPASIFCMAFSPDGKSLATACHNEPPRLWDWAAGREHKAHFRSDPAWPHTRRAAAMRFSSDGKTLYLGGQFSIERNQVTHALWHHDVATGKDLGPFGSSPAEASVQAPRSYLSFTASSGDGKTLVCSWANLLDVWDLNFGPGPVLTAGVRTTLHFPVGYIPSHLAVRADGKAAATADYRGLVYLWDTRADRPPAISRSEGAVSALHFSPDGKWLAVVVGKEVQLYDADSGAVGRRLSGHTSPVADVTFRADGGAVLSRSREGEVRLWDLTTGKELTLRGRPTLLAIQGLGPDGKTALTRQLNPETLRRWDLATGREVGRPEAPASNVFSSPDQGTRLTLEFESSIRLLDPATSQERFRLPLDSRLQQPQLVFSPDGKRVALVASEESPGSIGTKTPGGVGLRVVQVWDFAAGRMLASYRGTIPELWRPMGYSVANPAVVFSRDNRQVALVEMEADQAASRQLYVGTVRVLDLATGKAGAVMKPEKVTSLAFRGDGKVLATGGWQKVQLWDVAAGKEVGTLAHHRGGQVHVVGFTAEDSLLVLCLDTPRGIGPDPTEQGYEVVLWDPAADRLRAGLRGARPPAALSPDGRSLATVTGTGGSWGGHVIQVWDVFTAQQRAMLRGHRSPISELRFTPDGGALISHGWDNIFQWRSAWPNPAEEHYLDGVAHLWKLQRKLQNWQPAVDSSLNLIPAAKSFVKALESQPDHRGAYAGLARVLTDLPSSEKLPFGVQNVNRVHLRPEVIAVLRRLVHSRPDQAEAHFLLATALEDSSAAEALEEYRQVIRCDSKHAEAHARIGYLELAAGQEQDALAAFEHAVKIDPHSLEAALRGGEPPAPQALRRVARLFERHGRWTDAVTVHRRRVALAPNDLPCQLDLAGALRRSGRTADALSATRRCQELGGKTELHVPRQWAALEKKLPAGPHSRIESSDANELLALAELSVFKLRAPTAARCYAAALAAKSKLAERFPAACAAVLAGTGADREAAGLSEAERVAWRKQALAWLRAELAVQQQALEADAHQAAASVYAVLSSWQAEVDLSAVRDRLEGSQLPKEEQMAWTAFWSDAEVIRLRAAFVPTGLWWVDGTEIAQEQKTASACWLWLGETSWTDYDLEVEAQRVDGAEGFAVGFRVADRDNLLAANFGGWGNQRTGVEVRTEGDVKVHWATTWPQSIEAGRWYRVRVRARGDHFTVLLDDREILSLTEPSHPHGAIGLHSWNTANRFRNLKVTDPHGQVLFEGLPVIRVANRAALANALGQRGRYVEAAELFAAAAAASPQTLDRYNAACYSIRAGTEARDRSEEARRHFRTRAYDWLHAELEARRDAFEKSPSISTARDMAYWEQDADFHAVRAAEMLARLPAAEAQRWKKLWSEVAALRRRGEWVGCRKTWKIEGTELVQESERGEFMLLFGDPSWTDYDVELEAKPTRGSGEVNVVVRAASLCNLTVAILGGWNNSHHGIMPMVGLQWRAIATAAGKTTLGRWHKIKVAVRGRGCRLFVDGSLVVAAEGIPAAAGQVGLRTFGSAARFRNIKVTDPRGKVLFEGLPELPR